MSAINIVILLSLFLISSKAFRFSIIKGSTVDIKNFPFQIALMSNGKFYCGGSIIGTSFVLTAAHCTYRKSNFTIRAGSRFQDRGGVLLKVTKLIQHAKYVPLTFDFDFSLLRLEKDLIFNENIRPIPLPDLNQNIPSETLCIVSGYGLTENFVLSDGLMATGVNILDSKACGDIYMSSLNFVVTHQMICAADINAKSAEGNKDACSGDSGGPLVCNGILFGSVSAGNGCGLKDFPGVYGKVSSVRRWIQTNAGV